jgi:FkbM family methyltransferase
MSLVSTLKFIAGHPLNGRRKTDALLSFVKWQLGARLVPGRVVYDWIDDTRFIVRLGETGLTGNMYCGLHEFTDMAYVLHTTLPTDLFVDVGANVGSYTLLACSVRGARGICFEPVPQTYQRLLDNLRLNDMTGRVQAFNLGLSDRHGLLRFTVGENCMNHVVADGESAVDATRVDVVPLDSILESESPTAMKIDVEGFESAVVRGASKCLQKPSLNSVIMELNGSGERYGFSEDSILEAMKGHGFSTYTYEPFARRLRSLEGKNSASGNTLFIRDVAEIERRIAMAPRTAVAGVEI